MTNLTKEEFYRAAEDKSQFEAFVEKVIDNLPLVIDLEGLAISDSDGVIVPGIFNKILSSAKPVLLTNFKIESHFGIWRPFVNSVFVNCIDEDGYSVRAIWYMGTSAVYGLTIGDDDLVELVVEEF